MSLSHVDEEKKKQEAAGLAPVDIYDIIRFEGEEELARPVKSLVWSGIAAGVMISFSVLGEAVFRTHLPDDGSRYLIENLGYSLGFLLVILGRLQLFTENTITTVFPLVSDPNWKTWWQVIRLWSIVLAANVVGACGAAAVMAHTTAIPQELYPALLDLSHHALGFPPSESFMRAIPAGVLVAAIVWMLPQAKGSSFFVIVTFTWLIAAGDFTHVVAGSVEMWFLLLSGETGVADAVFAFFLPVLAGNIVGGTVIFTLMAWGQVQEEVKDQDEPESGQ